MKLSSVFIFVNIYENMVNKFLGDQVDLSLVESKDMKSEIGPLGAFKVSKKENIQVELVNKNNYSSFSLDLNSAFIFIYILSLNFTCWNLYHKGNNDYNLFGDEFYRVRNEFLDQNSDDLTKKLISFLD